MMFYKKHERTGEICVVGEEDQPELVLFSFP